MMFGIPGTGRSAAVPHRIVVAVLAVIISLQVCAAAGAPDGSSGADATAVLAAGGGSAKNVILMIGDGMGPIQVEAARWEKAGRDPAAFRSTTLAMDRLPYEGTVSTAAADDPVTDSAAAATALMTGEKTDRGVIGQDTTAVNGVRDGGRLTTIVELAKASGRETGAVTTGRITDATPGGVYAHVNDRADEPLIARQLLDADLDVALGGGYRFFIGSEATDPWGAGGARTDGRNLVTEATAEGYRVVTSASQLGAVPASDGTRVLGLFSAGDLAYEGDRPGTSQPDLAAMTTKALSILDSGEDGFFLMVEGEGIDSAAEANDYGALAGEILAFDKAVQTALAFVDRHPDTLLIVTADHETGGLTRRMSVDGSLSFSFTTAVHTAADVPIMAIGPGADQVDDRQIANTRVFEIMRDAMDVAPTTHAVPGTIQAEDYDAGGEGVAYHDATAGNSGGAYRHDDVDIETAGGVTNVGWIRDGEWLRCTATVARAGTYVLTARVASPNAGRTVALSIDGALAATIAVPKTGSFEAYRTVSVPVALAAGTHALRLTFPGDGQNLDWIAFG